MSLLGRMGADALAKSEYEALLAEAMEQPDKLLPLVADLSDVDPLRAEALLHAFPPGDGLPEAGWARPYRCRWTDVEAAMQWLASEGVTASSNEIDAVAAAALELMSRGRNLSVSGFVEGSTGEFALAKGSGVGRVLRHESDRPSGA